MLFYRLVRGSKNYKDKGIHIWRQRIKLHTADELLFEFLIHLGIQIQKSGEAFYALRLSELLSLFGASREVVEEVEQEEISLSDSPFKNKLSKAQDAVLNWWFDYSYDGRGEKRSDEFDLDLHYRSEEFIHNTTSYIKSSAK